MSKYLIFFEFCAGLVIRLSSKTLAICGRFFLQCGCRPLADCGLFQPITQAFKRVVDHGTRRCRIIGDQWSEMAPTSAVPGSLRSDVDRYVNRPRAATLIGRHQLWLLILRQSSQLRVVRIDVPGRRGKVVSVTHLQFIALESVIG